MQFYTQSQEFFYSNLSIIILTCINLQCINTLFSYEHRRKQSNELLKKTIDEMKQSLGPYRTFVYLIGIILVICTCIELVCRGYIFGYLFIQLVSCSPLVSNCLQSCVYAIISYARNYKANYDGNGHYRTIYIIREWLTGFILGYSYFYSGYLCIPIVSNAIINTIHSIQISYFF